MGVGWTMGGVSTNVGGSFVPFLFGLLGRLGAFIDWSLTLSHRNSTDHTRQRPSQRRCRSSKGAIQEVQTRDTHYMPALLWE